MPIILIKNPIGVTTAKKIKPITIGLIMLPNKIPNLAQREFIGANNFEFIIPRIKKSNAKFFGINSYPVQNNVDLKAFGHHRHINIELEPFNLNKPYLKLNDYERKFNIYKI